MIFTNYTRLCPWLMIGLVLYDVQCSSICMVVRVKQCKRTILAIMGNSTFCKKVGVLGTWCAEKFANLYLGCSTQNNTCRMKLVFCCFSWEETFSERKRVLIINSTLFRGGWKNEIPVLFAIFKCLEKFSVCC